jgi:heterodisulfide reductase subunit A2
VKNWDRLFPSRRPGSEVMDFIGKNLAARVDIRCGSEVASVERTTAGFIIRPVHGDPLEAGSVVLATGYDLFDARKKEEYGYGIYDNVITSAELEAIFKEGRPVTMQDGKTPRRIGIIHCVGSRDEKVGNLYCSKVCCVTGVKQAIEIREMLPGCEVYSFYMDLRMYDRNFEELYYEAQQKWGVNFIRGRLSECAENPDHSIVLKSEDTLTGRPLKMTVDLVVLLVGFTPRPETKKLAAMLGLDAGADGFLSPADEHTRDNNTAVPGLFLTGAVKGPACIVNTIADARAAAMQVKAYLNSEVAR